MFGVDTLWNFSAKYSGTISTNNFKRLCSALEKISNNVSVYMETEKMYKGTLDGINVSLNIDSIDNDDLLDENDYRQCIHFQIRDFRAQYENTIKILEADIVPYLSKINSIIKPEKSDFELTIKFFNGNPWAKAVTKGIKYDDILNMNFTVRVEDDKKAQGKVDIGKKDLRVTCNELHVLSQLIKRRLMVSM